MRHKDINWNLPDAASWDLTVTAVLMDLRDELKQLNAVFACPNFTEIPRVLREIRRNTTPKKKPRAVQRKKTGGRS